MPIERNVRRASDGEIDLVRSRIKKPGGGRKKRPDSTTGEVRELLASGEAAAVVLTGEERRTWHRDAARILADALRKIFGSEEMPVYTATDISSDDETVVVILPKNNIKS